MHNITELETAIAALPVGTTLRADLEAQLAEAKVNDVVTVQMSREAYEYVVDVCGTHWSDVTEPDSEHSQAYQSLVTKWNNELASELDLGRFIELIALIGEEHNTAVVDELCLFLKTSPQYKQLLQVMCPIACEIAHEC